MTVILDQVQEPARRDLRPIPVRPSHGGKKMHSESKITYLFRVIILSAFLLITPTMNNVFAEIIPQGRRIDWSQAGILGSIPHRTTICATTNVVTYGNGTTDATSAIKNAIDGFPANQVVYLPAGTYRVSSVTFR
jgi:hypothetical protein